MRGSCLCPLPSSFILTGRGEVGREGGGELSRGVGLPLPLLCPFLCLFLLPSSFRLYIAFFSSSLSIYLSIYLYLYLYLYLPLSTLPPSALPLSLSLSSPPPSAKPPGRRRRSEGGVRPLPESKPSYIQTNIQQNKSPQPCLSSPIRGEVRPLPESKPSNESLNPLPLPVERERERGRERERERDGTEPLFSAPSPTPALTTAARWSNFAVVKLRNGQTSQWSNSAMVKLCNSRVRPPLLGGQTCRRSNSWSNSFDHSWSNSFDHSWSNAFDHSWSNRLLTANGPAVF